MKICMVRHTAVGVPQGTCYGQTDVPLKETFEEEAAVVKKNLKNIDFDLVYSSPLSRCRKLANLCGYGEIAIYDGRLKELDMGDWEQQRWDDLDMTVWKDDWINNPPPNGESFMEMYKRVVSFLDALKGHTVSNVLIFTHSGVVSCARVYFGKADMINTFDKTLHYGEIVEFGY